ncbi:thioesterase family protein [Ornithobacterium rhinotracheale]|uniref:Putative thioesterase n=3 Tax=Ornithobacterium rhinotracheale TaxID=28251 RepID=I4A3G6_ORNRL|nr:thioesterase family protein [Ornithobacterium rhinotracheale]AFL98500.1 putative thioesterase [Ornithobacterium rhinotracheale DSM 15997]AIQ00221.1 thioesterase [Ornithobacterium rhinotracheale ORT-UMN 88]KGB65793.1 thioesterase [Ornithobacterium rhinotracheale H06-030791]MBN3662917.1 acyl-CoA thioesterase [Ornithobacterium rhinotracheale]MBN3663107.1 acyl-CoA thioesterase [Ornithobacterium rhinotracheale]
MIKGTTYIRVRYGETDQMGYAYYGNYAQYFEVGRAELLRNIGLNYKRLEEQGIMTPVLSLFCKYIAPAKYDDELCIETCIPEIPTGARIKFTYKITNEDGKLLTIGETELVFVDMKTGRPTSVPPIFEETLKRLMPENGD